MQQAGVRSNRQSLLYVILLMPFLEPLLFKEYPVVDAVFDIAKLLSGFVLVVIYLYRGRISTIILLVVSQQVLLLFSTYINNGSFSRAIGPALSVVFVAIWAELILSNMIDILRGVLFVYGFLVAINALSVLTESAVYVRYTTVYFLGIDNRFVFYLLPFVCFYIMYSQIKWGKISFGCLLAVIVSTITLLYTWSVAAMIGMCLVLIYTVLFAKKSLCSVFNSLVYFTAMAGLNLLIVVFHVQNYFAAFLTDVLHKDITLTNRTPLWDVAFTSISQHPAWGMGVQDLGVAQMQLLGVGHVHNLLLNMLYQGGIVSLGIFVVILFISHRQLYRYRHRLAVSGLAFCIFISMFLSIFDTLDYSVFYGLLVLGYHAAEIQPKHEPLCPQHRKDEERGVYG